MINRYNYIVIEGNIGVGKTSLASRIAGDFNARLITEKFADNPFLPKFYDNPERYSFPLELSFLAERHRQLREELGTTDMFKSFLISDYYFMKSLIFASETLDREEYNLYRQLFNIIYTTVPRPDLYVYLHARVERLLINIGGRGREYEKAITSEYLSRLQEGYFRFFRQNINMKYLIIDVSDADFVNSNKSYKKIQDIIFREEYQIGINRVVLSKI